MPDNPSYTAPYSDHARLAVIQAYDTLVTGEIRSIEKVLDLEVGSSSYRRNGAPYIPVGTVSSKPITYQISSQYGFATPIGGVATSLTPPAYANSAIIYVNTYDLKYRLDGVAPDLSAGFSVNTGSTIFLPSLDAITGFRASSLGLGNTEIHVEYFNTEGEDTGYGGGGDKYQSSSPPSFGSVYAVEMSVFAVNFTPIGSSHVALQIRVKAGQSIGVRALSVSAFTTSGTPVRAYIARGTTTAAAPVFTSIAAKIEAASIGSGNLIAAPGTILERLVIPAGAGNALNYAFSTFIGGYQISSALETISLVIQPLAANQNVYASLTIGTGT